MSELSQWVTVAEYSRIVGISERTLRRHIAAGKLEAQQSDRGLLLKAPEVAGRIDRQEPVTAGQAPDMELLTTRAEIGKLSALLEQVSGERDYLRGQLDKAASEREQLRIIIAQYQRSLPSGEPQEASPAQTTPVQPRRHWWQFGRGSTSS
jgi:hypothetical protein